MLWVIQINKFKTTKERNLIEEMKLSHLEFIFLFCLIDTLSSQIKLPFEIPGPRSFNDSIAIVGAGASGIHMALSLKEKGFKNVFVLEKENYIGGKSWTYNYHGTPHELGAVYLAPDYRDNVIKLVDKYAPGDLVTLQPASVWLDELNCPDSYKQYLISYATKHFNVTNETEAGTKIRDAVVRYIAFHESTFGEYEGEIMPEPTPEVFYFFEQLNLTQTVQICRDTYLFIHSSFSCEILCFRCGVISGFFPLSGTL